MSLRTSITLLTVVLGGIFSGVGFVFPLAWPLSFLGLIPLLWLIRTSSGTRSRSELFFYGLLFGLTLYSFALSPFFFSTLPLDWLGITDPPLQLSIVILSLILFVTVLAVPVGAFAVIAASIQTRTLKDLLYLPSLWVLAQAASALLLSIVAWAPQSPIGLHLSIGSLGYLLANDHVFLQLATLGGVYGLGFFIVVVNLLLAQFVFHNKEVNKKITIISLALIVVSWTTGQLFFTGQDVDQQKTLRVAILRVNVPASLYKRETEKPELAARYENLMRAVEHPDIIIMPEGGGTLNWERSQRNGWLSGWASSVFSETKTKPLIIDSTSFREPGGKLYSQIQYYDTANNANASRTQTKQLLLPYGEYMPYIVEKIFKVAGKSDVLLRLKKHRGFVAGNKVEIVEYDGVNLATLACSETLSPSLYRSVSGDVDIFFNTASHAWFHGSSIVYEQMQRIARVRAAESRRSYVQATNGAPSFVLSSYGEVLTESSSKEDGAIEMEVALRQDTTPYSFFGGAVLLVPVGALGLLYMRRNPLYQHLFKEAVSK